MKRRCILSAATTAGVGAFATAIALPAIAQSREIRWRMVSSFPRSLETLHGAAEHFVKRVAELTDNRFQIRLFAAGELVPPFAVLDAVQNETVEAGWTAAYYYWGKDPTFTFATAIPFGFNARIANAWYLHGGGERLVTELFESYNCHCIQAGNTGAQMGGWFRQEVRTPDDLKGLKFRVGGFAGKVLAKLGVVAQQIPAGEIYVALERGTIDAVEWVGPADDEKLGFFKVAKYYYTPGWWEGGAAGHTLVNSNKWKSLPDDCKATVTAASREAGLWMTARYDHLNPAALKRLIAGGALLRQFSPEIMDAAYKATQETCNEVADTNPRFRKMYDSVRAYRKEAYQWWQVCELAFDNYQARLESRG